MNTGQSKDQKIALITGANGSIGLSIAKKLAGMGVLPCLQVRSKNRLDQVDITQGVFPAGYRVFCADLDNEKNIDELFKEFTKEFDQLDFLIHSAGAIYLGEILEMPIEQMDWLYKVNLRAPLYLTQKFLPLLLKEQGQIVFINSSAANQSTWTTTGAYASTKLALKVVTDTIRNEVNGRGIRVLGIYPGRTSSKMQKFVHDYEKKEYRPDNLLQPEDIGEIVVSALNLPRSAEVTDIYIRPNKKS